MFTPPQADGVFKKHNKKRGAKSVKRNMVSFNINSFCGILWGSPTNWQLALTAYLLLKHTFHVNKKSCDIVLKKGKSVLEGSSFLHFCKK